MRTTVESVGSKMLWVACCSGFFGSFLPPKMVCARKTIPPIITIAINMTKAMAPKGILVRLITLIIVTTNRYERKLKHLILSTILTLVRLIAHITNAHIQYSRRE